MITTGGSRVAFLGWNSEKRGEKGTLPGADGEVGRKKESGRRLGLTLEERKEGWVGSYEERDRGGERGRGKEDV